MSRVGLSFVTIRSARHRRYSLILVETQGIYGKGCPFAINIQHELETLEKYFPAERKQCENIWKPVYDEYRRLGYRLKDKK